MELSCDIMNSFLLVLLLGSLCFCVAENPTESAEWDTRLPDMTEKYSFRNCTQCDVQPGSTTCICFENSDACVICCSNVSCCICPDCFLCWYEQQQLILMTQIGISVLFACGIIGLIVVYCKICNRMRPRTRRARRRCIVLHEENDSTTPCSTVEGLRRERPPTYNEVIRSSPPVYASSDNNAPPLYTSPSNRASMQEAPPSYPGTPKPQDKSKDDPNKFPSSPPIAQHI
ncbi:PREDICTED: uncharacterized protein LOC105570052 [Vollenhovia emeryi]|uniref:uncharacterized protein LOC105570052 n=1 Tax=Vollenhovia emeryi TaxID=411798 RepID=UPI0005F36A31|nr:PREDICTED: uncharacterized protein LOC105570052 [Vollenhovia emeryi]